MKRRHFITSVSASSLFLGLKPSELWASSIKKSNHLTILHTNDVHSHVEPFSSTAGRNANKGGVARRAALIAQIKKENPNTLLLDAGDIFQGTPYFNFYGGELELKLMSMMGYDAGTIGNHEFDNGIEGLSAPLHHANFDLLIANYDFSNTIMDGRTKAYKIFNKNGIRVGVFGLGIELDGLVNKRAYKETVYLDPIEKATDMAYELRHRKHCDLVICLSHLGYRYQNPKTVSDIHLAEKTRDIDLIIGGHTHTFLKEPDRVLNLDEKEVLINQVGCYGLYLGRIDFQFGKAAKLVKNLEIG